jgi:hypothetical protein
MLAQNKGNHVNKDMKALALSGNMSLTECGIIKIYTNNPQLTYKEIAKSFGCAPALVSKVLKNPLYKSMIWDMYMDTASHKLTHVVESMMDEAISGSVAAAKLVLELHEKISNTLTIRIDSPYQKFQEAMSEVVIEDTDDVIDAEFEEAMERVNVDDIITDRIKEEKVKAKERVKQRGESSEQNQYYELRKRANAVDYPLMGAGKPTAEKRRAWLKGLEKKEKEVFGDSSFNSNI